MTAFRKPVASAPKQRLALVDDGEHGAVCQGLTELPITDLAEVMQALNEGNIFQLYEMIFLLIQIQPTPAAVFPRQN